MPWMAPWQTWALLTLLTLSVLLTGWLIWSRARQSRRLSPPLHAALVGLEARLVTQMELVAKAALLQGLEALDAARQQEREDARRTADAYPTGAFYPTDADQVTMERTVRRAADRFVDSREPTPASSRPSPAWAPRFNPGDSSPVAKPSGRA